MTVYRIARVTLFCLFLLLAWHGAGPGTTPAMASAYFDGPTEPGLVQLAGGRHYSHYPYWRWRHHYHHRYPYWQWRKYYYYQGYPYWYWRKHHRPYKYRHHSFIAPGVDVRVGKVGVGVFPNEGVFVRAGGVKVGVGSRGGVEVRVEH